MPLSLLFFFFLFSSSSGLSHTTTSNRRALHQPFFPASPPPPPPEAPPPSPSLPKYPSSTNPQPFFPSFSGPPPPPPAASTSTSIPTFPANISSLIYPDANSPRRRRHSSTSKLLPSILLPLLLLSLLSLTLAFFLLLRRRRRRHQQLHSDKPLRSDGHRLFPSSDGRKSPSGPAVSEFLYLGTLVSSRRRSDGDPASSPPPDASSPYRKLSSPELRPLPPLSRLLRHGIVDAGCSSDEEFYSPRGSSAEKESSKTTTTFRAVAGKERGRSGSPTLSTLSYPSSDSASSAAPSSPAISSPPAGWAPGRSGVKVPFLRSDSAGAEKTGSWASPTLPPPHPPPLPTLLRSSPPKRKPPSSSSERSSSASSGVSSQSLQSPARIGGPMQRQPPPPPPPPPPPSGYWESRVRRPQASQPPDLVTPRSIGLKDHTMSALTAEQPESSEKSESTPRPKLKPLHWDKVRASSDRVMVWDQLKSSSFQVNEEMIETLFGCNNANPAPKDAAKRQVIPSPGMENRVLDPKKAQNIAILLRALNVTKEEVCEALLEGNSESLGTELLETLLKMAPSREEEVKLKEYKDDSPVKLGQAEKFLKAVLDVPFAFKRVDAMLYITNFESEVNYLKKSFETLEVGCEELRNSRLFLKLLDAVLKTGNRMNVGTNRGDAHAFKLDTLLKLVDVKGTDGNTTLLHFVVQEIIKSEGSRLSAASSSPSRTGANVLQDNLKHKKLGLQAVGGLGGELSNVKKAAAMDSDVLGSYVSKLAGGIGKVRDVLRLNDTHNTRDSGQRFRETMNRFLEKAEDEIIRVQAQESVALSLVKEITEYFHGNSTKEEAHPFRIFMVVRDFLSILDQVCKEVGKINERSFVSSARQFPVPVNPTLPPLFPRLNALRPESSDDESSSLSS